MRLFGQPARSLGISVAFQIRSGGRTCQTTSPGSQTSVRHTHHDQGARMQPSMFNVRVPLEDRNDVFLMNTFTDAQLIVSRDVADAARSPRARGTSGWTSDERDAHRHARRARLHRREPRRRSRATCDEFFHEVRESTRAAAHHGADDAAVQLRLRLLHPGRSRRLQQARREDVARDGGAGRPTGPSSGSTRSRPESFVLTFFGGEPLLNLPVMYLPRRAAVAGLRGARRADARSTSSPTACC